MPERYRSIIDVHVILERGNEILLLERQGTGYCDGMLHLPSGHLDEGETLAYGAAREAREEVGIRIDPADLRLTTVVHHRQRADHARVGVFFATNRWDGEPYNAEPHKCGKLLWCEPALLPSNTIDYPATGITAYRTKRPLRHPRLVAPSRRHLRRRSGRGRRAYRYPLPSALPTARLPTTISAGSACMRPSGRSRSGVRSPRSPSGAVR